MKEREIISIANSVGVKIIALTNEERKSLALKLDEQLGIRVDRRQIWGLSDAPDGVACNDEWSLIAEYIGDNTCFFFTEGMPFCLRFNDGRSLLLLIEESPPIEFYVCDREASYMLCLNDHDYLIGWGKAEPWVKDLIAPAPSGP
jgi:hypothetical protein